MSVMLALFFINKSKRQKIQFGIKNAIHKGVDNPSTNNYKLKKI